MPPLFRISIRDKIHFIVGSIFMTLKNLFAQNTMGLIYETNREMYISIYRFYATTLQYS